MKVTKHALVLLAFLSMSAVAHAESESFAMPQDTKLVQFPFDPNNTYTILARPWSITDIQLAEGEKLVAFAAGDSVQWIFAKTDGHVFLKPIKPNIFTSATMVTDQRTYQLTLRASPENGNWYQRVSWVYPDVLLMKQEIAREKQKQQEAELLMARAEAKMREASEKAVVVNKTRGNPVENLNFEYEIIGDAEFKPQQVFDDGKFVWIRIKKNSGVEPAVFVLNEDGGFDLITTVKDGDFIKTTRMFQTAVLKLGKQEIKIVNKAAPASAASTYTTSSSGGFPWQTTR